MAELSKSETAALKKLQQDASWDMLLRILGRHIDDINAEEVAGNNEFETLRMLHRNQGRVAGLKDFFDFLERGAFN